MRSNPMLSVFLETRGSTVGKRDKDRVNLPE